MPPDAALWIAVQGWLYREARLLDARRFDLWLDLLDPDVRYHIPSRAFVRQGDPGDFSTWAVEREIDTPGSLPLIDDDLAGLRARVGRLRSGMAWAETPPSMTRRLIGNVQVAARGDEGRLDVTSVIFLTKTRRDERVLFSAERRDVLTPAEDSFRLRSRLVVLDDVVLTTGNLSVLF